MCCFGGAPAVGGRGGKEAASGRIVMHDGSLWFDCLSWVRVLVLDSLRYTLEHDMHFVCVCVCCLCSAVSELSQVVLTYSYVKYKLIL